METEFSTEDFKSIMSRIQHEEEQRNLKRSWLMGIPTILNSGQKQLKRPKFLKKLLMPESMLREDDVSSHALKICVEKGFEAFRDERGYHVAPNFPESFDPSTEAADIVKVLFSKLDEMNYNGLYRLSNMLTGTTFKFEKTFWRVREEIKEYFRRTFRDQNHNDNRRILLKQLSQLLKDPHNFRENSMTHVGIMSQYRRAAAIKVLDGFGDMPLQTLTAMHRRLRGVQIEVPQLRPSKSGWNRDRLIEQVRNTCNIMLSELGEGDELPQSIAKAMAIADLSFKLTTRDHNFPLTEFYRFSPEIEALQSEILNAIWLLNKVKPSNLQELQLLLDPEIEFQNRRSRTAIRRLLTEYLFDCSEMDTIPKLLKRTLAIINRGYQSNQLTLPTCFSKEAKDKEIECVLTVSSQMRQIVWDLHPDHQFDQEFVDAYMEDLEENDDNGYDDKEMQPEVNKMHASRSCSNCSIDQVESIGESISADSTLRNKTIESSISHSSASNGKLNDNFIKGSRHKQFTDLDPGDQHGSGSLFSSQESSFLHEMQKNSGNQYLVIQENCDETSKVSHQLIGHLFEKFMQIEGKELDWRMRAYLKREGLNPDHSQATKLDSLKEGMDCPIFVQVVEELMPSLPKSVMERTKELMGLQ
ncbi:uncharacterized protein LOC122644077 [Telopea speciosissima]|uniref:uncharacterized protein LOC122644077 n=1 Tax=Telopea speciosissima TaxID=54955 RepID=UPI001CC5ED45|nr:uncharacterized protein LOC122644077 [Telopea speciosissima]